MRAGNAFAAVSCIIAFVGCVMQKQMFATSDDFADYRAFRIATYEGARLARAEFYLWKHPRGAWADEVRGVFEVEEAAWFERAKASRNQARDYMVDLPHGPHAEAARALIALFDDHEANMDMLELLAASRRTSATLDLQSERRRRVSEVIFEEVAALLDSATWGARLDEPPHSLANALRGGAPRTWGSPPLGMREDDLYFIVPKATESDARVAQVRLRIALDRGRVVGGEIGGGDLFIRWAEANEIRVLDAASTTDRAAAASDVVDVLAGAFEARFPAGRCAAQLREGEILARACDGWRVSVRMGARAGAEDVIAVRGPPPRKTPAR